jgi:hypothetical protein
MAQDMTMKQAVADTYPVIRIDNPDLKGLLALPMDADSAKQSDGKHFSVAPDPAQAEGAQ